MEISGKSLMSLLCFAVCLAQAALAQDEPIEAPITIFVDESSCDFGDDIWEFRYDLRNEGEERGVPITVTLRRDRADYVVHWGYLAVDSPRLTENRYEVVCQRLVALSDPESGEILYYRRNSAIFERNQYNDFFELLVAIESGEEIEDPN